MNKSLGLLFAVTSMAWLTATAISIAYNGWLAALFFVLGMCNIGFGFAVKARVTRKART
ncbi:hypothetical protein [Cohnella zeiphila]|uniref:Uncharacterized protein n=1 Tax=Cohnella zeiphila TaxID=2761120 RepID=A0A7X0SKX1_9BACL|nr:hypothetical protein [Cohnella zeiphila]MBB6730709.1 hypothetical protein [Cohnella zeiphila]